MEDTLAQHGVRVIALSKDTAQEAAIHRARDGIRVLLLCDPQLEVIRQYGVEHHKAFGFDTGSFSLFGIPFALLPSFKTMAIPTSLLIDEHGIVRWIDQPDDYRLRSDEDRVMGAVRAAFDGA